MTSPSSGAVLSNSLTRKSRYREISQSCSRPDMMQAKKQRHRLKPRLSPPRREKNFQSRRVRKSQSGPPRHLSRRQLPIHYPRMTNRRGHLSRC